MIIAVTLTIYIITGKDIFRQRKLLRSFSAAHHVPMPQIHNPFTVNNPVTVRKVTEIRVTSQPMSDIALAQASETAEGKLLPAVKTSICSRRQRTVPTPLDLGKGETLATGDQMSPSPSPSSQRSLNEDLESFNHWPSVECTASVSTGEQQSMAYNSSNPTTGMTRTMREHNAAMRANTAVWGYAKVAMLMFVAMLVIWVSSLCHYQFERSLYFSTRFHPSLLSLIIFELKVPSTFNRVYSLVLPDNTVFILNALAAAVLPMQGFWNCTIYIATSWPQCKDAYRQIGLNKLLGCIGSRCRRVAKFRRWPGAAGSANSSQTGEKGAGKDDENIAQS